MAFSIVTHNGKTIGIITMSKMTLSRMPYIKMTLDRTTLSITMKTSKALSLICFI